MSIDIQAILESGTAEWLQIISLVFGGCCSNVWALEAVLKEHPGSGSLLTFAQIVWVAIQNVGSHLYVPANEKKRIGDDKARSGSKESEITPKSNGRAARTAWTDWVPRLRRREVPIWRWGVQVVLFLSVSLLNNYAFAFKIPITLHIIFRSGGLCVSMLMGWLVGGKRYSVGQIVAGLVITSGIVLATLSAPSRRRSSTASTGTTATTNGLNAQALDSRDLLFGVTLLSIALFFSALLGLWQEKIYAKYGTVWREGLFYSHLLSIPFFAPLHSSISTTFVQYASTPSVSLISLPPIYLPNTGKGSRRESPRPFGLAVPSAIAALAVNVVTQGLCVKGVNRLTSKVSSTTVNLILTIRKAVSLGISVWYYGSGVTPGLAIGGGMVLGGTLLYSVASASHSSNKQPVGSGKRIADQTEAEPNSASASAAENPNNPSAISTGAQVGANTDTIRQRRQIDS